MLNMERKRKARPSVDPFVKLEDYVSRYLAGRREEKVEASTLRRYDGHAQPHPPASRH